MRGVGWIEWIALAIRVLKARVPTLNSEDTYDFGHSQCYTLGGQ